MTSSLILQNVPIRQIDGLYCLNDAHLASGNNPNDRPGEFIRLKQTVGLISEIENAGIPAIKKIRGTRGGTYACKELVIAYAAWISPTFHLKVLRVFLESTEQTEKPKTGKYHYPKQLLKQPYFTGDSGELYGTQLTHPRFYSPLADLLHRLEQDNNDVEACKNEYVTMKKVLSAYNYFFESMQCQMLAVRTERY